MINKIIPDIEKIVIEDDGITESESQKIDKIIENTKKLLKTNLEQIIYLKKDEYSKFVEENSDLTLKYCKGSKYNTNIDNNNPQNSDDPVNPLISGKKYTLLLQRNPGIYIKKCPGTPNYICCNYFITSFYQNCSLNCTYCFLKFYLKNDFLIIYYDIDRFFDELSQNKSIKRLGSGELADSLLFDPITEYSKILLQKMKNYPSTIFEFKTKTTNIDVFLDSKPLDNIVIGFSLNPYNISKIFEKDSIAPANRIEAAKLLIEKGWKVSFHFDPIILLKTDDGKILNTDNYKSLFETISTLPSENIAWVSIGTLRYHQDLIDKLRASRDSRILLKNEIIYGLDGKVRYFYKDREKIYMELLNIYKRTNANFPLYFCMESERIYLNTFGQMPWHIDKLKESFIF
ncbi:MAG TPA: hypothetical protein PK520_01230 [Exilispira sp.]|nr:hypothetical protein [Exilispira sp.]